MKIFTFQYGQIYYASERIYIIIAIKIYIPIWLDLLYIPNRKNSDEINNLHSNMVRFIIDGADAGTLTSFQFTFQYGQIYYVMINYDTYYDNYIYIPIWLDLLSI